MINVAVIGIGLIGGSMALDLKMHKKIKKIVGVDNNPKHLDMAISLGLIQEAMPLEKAVIQSDLIILSTPVNVSEKLLPEILSLIDKQVVFDVGSTKEAIIKSAEGHQNRGRFVATHPMAGTEYSGPEAALNNLFRSKTVIFCDTDKTDDDAFQMVNEIYEFLGMNRINMDPVSHDVHAAYVSHISHISSFALALTVLEKEKYYKNILTMAGGGFDSTVRLAKSSPDMWTPILLQNSENIIEVIDSYISVLHDFKDAITKNEPESVKELILQANQIRKVLDKPNHKAALYHLA